MTVKDQVAERAEVVRQNEGSSPQPAQGPRRRTILEKLKDQQAEIARALPKHMTADRFTLIVLTECKRTPKLLECTESSLLGACMVAAQLGLEPGPLGHCYLVPFKSHGTYEVTLIIGYKGIVDLARRSGHIESIVAREVCEHDEFSFSYGLDEQLVHRPALSSRGKVIAYYGVARFKDGGHQILVMSPQDVDAYRARSRASSGPWDTDYDAMAKKTVIRRMAAFLPLSIESAEAVAADESVARFRPDTPEVLDVESHEVTAEASVEPAEVEPATADPESPARGQRAKRQPEKEAAQ